MIKRLMVAVPVAIALALSACAPFVSTSGEGAIQILLGTPTGARALSDPPFSQLPVFSGITIKVSGPGMDPVEFTVSPSQTSFTAMVPGGSNRRVELYAPVDWDATNAMLTTLYPLGIPPQPTLVKAYGATTTIDVVPGQSVTAVLRLEVVETKILLPDVYNDNLLAAVDSISYSGSISEVPQGYYSFGPTFDFEFDRYGRVFFSSYGDLTVLSSFVYDASISLGPNNIQNVSINKNANRLYLLSNYQLLELDLSLVLPVATTITIPSGYSPMGMGLAADTSGFLYVCASRTIGQTTEYGVLKFSSADPSKYQFATEQSLGLVYDKDDGQGGTYPFSLDVRDMTVKDGKLYVLAGENDTYSIHHGKLVEINIATLAEERELGWTSADMPTSPSTQFYGPQRFIALAPRKLIIADEGFDGNANVDRVVEVDLDSWSISAIGLEGAVSFFNDYQSGI